MFRSTFASSVMLRLSRSIWAMRRADFYRDLADALERKVGIRDHLLRALSNARMLKDQATEHVVRALLQRLAAGESGSLSDLFSGIAPRSDHLPLAAVDRAENKPLALRMTAAAVEFQIKSLRTLAKELAVPIVAVVLTVVVVAMTSSLIVKISAEAPPVIWTGFNGFVRDVATFVLDYGLFMLMGLAVAFSVLVMSLPRWIGVARLKVEAWPFYSLWRAYNAAIVLSSIAMMVSAGLALREALETIRQTSGPWLRWHVSRIILSLEEEPEDYLAAFGRGLMPPTVRARLASLMDSARSFGDVLVTLGDKEVAALGARVTLAASALSWGITVCALSLAVLMSVGQMTIASAMANATTADRIVDGG